MAKPMQIMGYAELFKGTGITDELGAADVIDEAYEAMSRRIREFDCDFGHHLPDTNVSTSQATIETLAPSDIRRG